MTIGDRIKQKRKENKLSQEDVGRFLDPMTSKAAAESKIKRFEVNGQEPTIEELSIMADRMGCSLKWLITGEGEEKTVPEGTSREIMLLLETMRDRLNDQSRHIEDAVKVITRYKDELQDIQKAQIDINRRIGNIRAAMDEAAKLKSFEPLSLGGDAVNE